jgi:hypothetical protein
MERFSDIVDAVNDLPPDDQFALAQILKQRLAARERSEIVKDVAEARGEYQVEELKPRSAGSIMEEFRDDA